MHIGSLSLESPVRRYLLCLGVVAVLTFLATRLVSGQTGRSLIAIRDSELAARVLGVKVLRTKLFIFAVSSFYIGVAGALWSFAYLRTVEPDGFDLDRSFEILFVIIIGGLASIRGAFLGAALHRGAAAAALASGGDNPRARLRQRPGRSRPEDHPRCADHLFLAG